MVAWFDAGHAGVCVVVVGGGDWAGALLYLKVLSSFVLCVLTHYRWARLLGLLAGAAV
jgi:hypothetical protein